ncbi:DNA topoisomerase I-like protein [Streptomyces puniciscabiei]|uniref:DNA topoisomerase I-like protein n=1 Tax=Streptomyces puniciscabiei TaxID=164348 RepID=A0A542SXY1_9ACTN|nr:hypothetical protein [Streptomyces puniciscabiei]TQK79464.1 DNA topoisomerase I-like protein [Streptomyces puniciscabiei]
MDLSLAERPPPGRRHGRRRAPPVPDLYHERFRAEHEKAKHEHVRQVARALPELRAQVALDLAGRGLSPSRVTACAVRLLDLGFFRIGSDRHTRVSETYGLTTMLREHVTRGREEVTFSYPAKGGVETVRALVDEQVRAVARALLRRPRGGDRFLAHYARGFRTWHATVLAAVAVAVTAESGRASPAARRRQISRPSARSAKASAARPPREPSRRRSSVCWTAPADEPSARIAFYAEFHDRARCSPHRPSAGPGARGVPGEAGRTTLQDHGDRRSGGR